MSEKTSELDLLEDIADDDEIPVVDKSDTSLAATGKTKRSTFTILTSKFRNRLDPGDVLNFDADPTGVSDSTESIQASVDSSHPTSISDGDWRIDGTVNCDKEAQITCNRGAYPNERYWGNSSQAPFDFTVGSRCRLFKDNASNDVPFFKVRWSGVNILGFPVLDVSEKDSFTSAGVLYACDKTNPLVSGNTARIWGGRVEILGLGNISTISDAGEGMRMIQVSWGATGSDYITMMEWEIYGQYVGWGLYLPARNVTSQFATNLDMRLYLDGFKQAVYNYQGGISWFEGTAQTRNVLDATEHPMPVIDMGASQCVIDVTPWDMDSAADGNGHYRPSYFLKNAGIRNQVRYRGSPTWTSVYGNLPRPGMTLNSPFGYIPHATNAVGDEQESMVMSSFHNMLRNFTLKSNVTSAVYSGVADSDTAVSDAVFANASGNSVDITSALNELPSLTVGALFTVSDHSADANNGEYRVTATVTDGYTCEKSTPIFGEFYRNPSNASVEAITATTGIGAIVTDSATASVTTSSDITLSNFSVLNLFDADVLVQATTTQDSVDGGDYIEVTTDFNHLAIWMWLTYRGVGWYKLQIIRRLSGNVVANVLVDAPNIDGTDPPTAIKFAVDSTADETIIRFIGPRSVGTALFEDIGAFDRHSTIHGPIITTQGNKTIYGPLTMGTGGGIVERMATSAQLGDDGDAINTGAAKRLGFRVYNTTTKTDYVAQGNADNSAWIDTSDGTTTITPS